MCGDYDEYIGYGDTKEEIAELLYRDNYTSGAIYEVTGMVPDFKLRKPTQEEENELYRDGHSYYGEFDQQITKIINEKGLTESPFCVIMGS